MSSSNVKADSSGWIPIDENNLLARSDVANDVKSESVANISANDTKENAVKKSVDGVQGKGKRRSFINLNSNNTKYVHNIFSQNAYIRQLLYII